MLSLYKKAMNASYRLEVELKGNSREMRTYNGKLFDGENIASTEHKHGRNQDRASTSMENNERGES